MLKTLSLSADEERAEAAAEAAEHDNSERRMLRSLEALGNQPAPQNGQNRDGGFRKPQAGAPTREPFRGEPHHANKARHRFVRDGEVQVVRAAVPRPRELGPGPIRLDPEISRLQALVDDAKLRAEQSERARKEAADQCKTLHTKLAHAELALNDAQILADSRAREIEALLERLAATHTKPAVVPPAPRMPDENDELFDAPRRGPGRPRKIPLAVARPAEPEPVEWWLLPARTKRR